LDPDLVARKIGDAGASLYASNEYLARHPAPMDPSDLRGHELIGYDQGLSALPAAKWMEQHASGATIVLRCREMTELVTAAASGAGIAMLSCWLADQEPGLRRLTDQVLVTREISVVYRREARLSAAVRAAIDFVTGILRENATVLAG
jgi:DNA-binding transcriptional LysR family regulator